MSYIWKQNNFHKLDGLFWCPEAESNHRHGDFQSPALPTELSGHMAEKEGFEPSHPFWKDLLP